MIVTLTENANGQRRIYLGGKSSLECWLAPTADGIGWTFHLNEAVAGNKLDQASKRRWAVYMLHQLATALKCSPENLAAVPFAKIGALHTADPYLDRRVTSPKRRVIENGFTAVDPNAGGPGPDFTARNFAESRHRRRY